MNKLLLILSFCIISCWANAQSFTDKALTQAVSQLNSSKTANDYDNLFTKFSGSKTSEKWSANYYAAVALYLKNELLLKTSPGQNLIETNALARKIATGIWTSQRDNAEINTLIGLLHFQKIQLNDTPNLQQDMDVISQSITKAEAGSPNNPRLAILKARLKEKTGDKAAADLLFQKASNELQGQNSGTATPTWGKQLLPSSK
ncbi:hypothetical protein [Chryseobacterium sp. Mn2064]|uniref:hypothetical protein n=1 Tax=Chryseobacterium sp. Mn2064 TaxID=3395263 RepID=UPI003BDE0C3D